MGSGIRIAIVLLCTCGCSYHSAAVDSGEGAPSREELVSIAYRGAGGFTIHVFYYAGVPHEIQVYRCREGHAVNRRLDN